MDFDDTWHPATHPSGAVLPALLAISDMLHNNSKPSGLDFLTAFSVGIEIQGRLMRFSKEAHNIPKRLESISLSQLKRAIIACLCTAVCVTVLVFCKVKHMQLGGSEHHRCHVKVVKAPSDSCLCRAVLFVLR